MAEGHVSARAAFRVLGIDPGLNTTGYAAMDFAGVDGVIVEAGAIRTTTDAPMARRIEQIHADLAELLAELRPDRVAVEKLYAHYKHPRTSILMAHARGVILLAAQQAGVGVIDLAATEVKKSLTGNGHASKQQMQRAIQTVCRLDAVPEPPDVADAMAIALCAGRHLGRDRRAQP
ncbi:MAG: crossover junction endodeoxyribonuclease RuvC [Planctomycetes bacterium]|nr:crossover junction endodeoxyribonuclease RuvC [Planctomycetota bacterium]